MPYGARKPPRGLTAVAAGDLHIRGYASGPGQVADGAPDARANFGLARQRSAAGDTSQRKVRRAGSVTSSVVAFGAGRPNLKADEAGGWLTESTIETGFGSLVKTAGVLSIGRLQYVTKRGAAHSSGEACLFVLFAFIFRLSTSFWSQVFAVFPLRLITCARDGEVLRGVV